MLGNQCPLDGRSARAAARGTDAARGASTQRAANAPTRKTMENLEPIKVLGEGAFGKVSAPARHRAAQALLRRPSRRRDPRADAAKKYSMTRDRVADVAKTDRKGLSAASRRVRGAVAATPRPADAVERSGRRRGRERERPRG